MHTLITLEGVEGCRVRKRLNRFVVEVEVDDKVTTAYINNTGRLLDYLREDKKGFCLRNSNEKKTDYRLFAVEKNGFGAVIDTNLQMKAFEKALSLNLIPWLNGWEFIKRNVRLGESVIDYLFRKNSVFLYLEVKSAVLKDGDYAMYPDCPSIRGQRHIWELITHVSNGGEAAILFIAALPKVKAFKPYESGDPVVKTLLVEAEKVGVMIKSISIFYNPRNAKLHLENPDLDVVL
ncbi:MAG TPA: DNA/RNA nuclease SfsA [Thermoplasmatales archaeon]|nr:DNA/RNA nuclease SfsA [Thermoplasmatales archaeon]